MDDVHFLNFITFQVWLACTVVGMTIAFITFTVGTSLAVMRHFQIWNVPYSGILIISASGFLVAVLCLWVGLVAGIVANEVLPDTVNEGIRVVNRNPR